ncbi:MAG TPA: nucleotide exchange factor GrpE [Micromonospora sp.]
MTQEPRAADGAAAAANQGGSDGPEKGQTERVIIRDRRRVDPTGTRVPGSASPRHAAPETDDPALQQREADEQAKPETPAGEAPAAETQADVPAEAPAESPAESPAEAQPEDTSAAELEALRAEVQALRAQLEERTSDLQRVTAEYANYRKRVERDRGLAAEQAVASVLTALLPILDDLDRAREHGDLVGPFGAVAEQLINELGKFGLVAFGEKGDRFDPNKHEAVAHVTSADVTESTCVEVMRRGYLMGDRLLRAALVTVADPE